MVKIDNISKTYNKGLINETKLFDNFSLEIKTGEFVSVVGSNGSGKSSILNLICGTIPVDSGKIILDDKDITNMKEYKRADFIGRIFQDPTKGTCPSMTILENMSLADSKGKGFGLDFCVKRKRIELYKDLLKKLKLGLEDKVDVKVGSLSGGQRQALSLLISTATPLGLLILDEHTAALDPATCDTIMILTEEIIKENKMTALMVTHNLKYAIKYGDRVLMMHQGNVVFDKSGEDKRNVNVNELMEQFNGLSVI